MNDSLDTNRVITAKNENPTAEGKEMAFDGNTGTKWLDLTTGANTWIQVQFTNQAYVIQRYGIAAANDAAERDPKSWTLSGSKDGTTWVVLDTQVNQPQWHDRNDWKFWGLANTEAYSYYKLEATNNSGAMLQISELGLFESVGGGVPRPELMVEKSAGSVIISLAGQRRVFMLFQTPVLGTGATWTEVGAGTLNGTTRSVTVTPVWIR